MTLHTVSDTNASVLKLVDNSDNEFIHKLVPGEGLEPSHCLQHRILSPARLPIPPSRHVNRRIIHETEAFIKSKRCSI